MMQGETISFITIGIVILLSFLAAVAFTALEIPMLRKKQAGQNIREEGPKSHYAKAGTPSMGGLSILVATLVGAVVGGYDSRAMYLILLVFFLFAFIGFFDDYLKIMKKINLGLRAWQKFGIQILISLGLAACVAKFSGLGTTVWVPFFDRTIDLGIWYIPYIAFVMLAMTNAVNLTDGLDGLAGGITAQVALFFAIVGTYYEASDGASAFSAALAGACLGFLVFNKNPAKVFMGDTGSLALGGGLAAAAIVMHFELLLPIVGLVYVLEALSVIIQVGCFKLTGKRVFKMAPIHHHFELSGLKEKYVVLIFWLFAFLCCIFGFGILG